MKFFQFFIGNDGEMSSKRLFLFLFVIVAVVYVLTNLYTGKALKDSVEDYLFMTIWGFFFGVAADRWRKPNTIQKSDD